MLVMLLHRPMLEMKNTGNMDNEKGAQGTTRGKNHEYHESICLRFIYPQ